MSDRSPLASHSWADALFEQAKAHQECYIAGVQAADENSPSARKLARLLPAAEAVMAILDAGDGDPMSGEPSVKALRKFAKLVRACDNLRVAIEDARK